ncbi:hypothetical protein [Caballeronia sp. GAFFF2]|uniref:hypothetical protein n=1 Tax=Caballeronia sp. GAFFF2 TaxID=2921741 RepID=UPI002027F6B4|nr:hypothetical protein [Caballeronia sp. GAFFF2]
MSGSFECRLLLVSVESAFVGVRIAAPAQPNAEKAARTNAGPPFENHESAFNVPYEYRSRESSSHLFSFVIPRTPKPRALRAVFILHGVLAARFDSRILPLDNRAAKKLRAISLQKMRRMRRDILGDLSVIAFGRSERAVGIGIPTEHQVELFECSIESAHLRLNFAVVA